MRSWHKEDEKGSMENIDSSDFDDSGDDTVNFETGFSQGVQETDRSLASYSSRVASAPAKGLIVLTKEYLCEFGKKVWKDEELSHLSHTHGNRELASTTFIGEPTQNEDTSHGHIKGIRQTRENGGNEDHAWRIDHR